MNLTFRFKRLVEYVPPPMGKFLAHVPYSWRLGPVYGETRRDIGKFDQLSFEERKIQITERFKSILTYAYRNNEFYRNLCWQKEFDPYAVRTFEDIQKVPIVTRADLRDVEINNRSQRQIGRMLINTGGTSGEPLSFYIDRHAFAREWAHMHSIWSVADYRTTDLKLTFRGKNLGRSPLRYNAVHNEYLVNGYCPPKIQAESIKAIAQKVRFIHGYPSSIYEFVRFCAEENPKILELLRSNLKAVLLGSEYPVFIYRDLIEEKLRVQTISWYGHSEMAALAYESEKYVYVPFQTYGYCEAVPDGKGNYRLVGTSYYNRVSPFIRYDTGDLIIPVFDGGLLASFRIASGRVGEFVEDLHGRRISLTALIFGRHHKIFNTARFVQIKQEEPGRATIFVVLPKNHGLEDNDVSAGFDLSNVAIDFSFETRESPIRSPSGKVPLLVPCDQIARNTL